MNVANDLPGPPRMFGLGLIAAAISTLVFAASATNLVTPLVFSLLAIGWGMVLGAAWLMHLRELERVAQQAADALLRGEPVRGPMGSAANQLRAQMTHRDATRQREHDASQATLHEGTQQAKRTDEAARSVLQRSRVAVAIIAPEGHIEFINPSFRRVFRLSREPVGSRPIEAVPAIECHELVQTALGGRTVEHSGAHGAADLRMGAAPVTGGGAVFWAEDITPVTQAQRSRQDFVANVSHELRTPAAAIRGYAETILLDADRLPKDIVPLVEIVERNSRRLSEMFEDLLRLHRIQARSAELPLEYLALLPIVTEASGGALEKAANKNQRFVIEGSADVKGWVHPDALSTIVTNLTANATNYTPEGGEVVVTVGQDDDGVFIRVRDNGIGISKAHHERVFERFYRVDDARSRDVGGTGLGLAIVRHMALGSRAQLSLHSEDGQGCEFEVRLPKEA